MSGLIPEPYSFLYFATSGESQGVGTGPAGFGGAGCPAAAAGAAGLAAAGTAGLAGAGGAAAFGGIVTSEGGDGLVGVSVDFTPPGAAGLSTVGFSFSGGGGVGDLVSSGISDGTEPGAGCVRKNVHFYQLEQEVSNQIGLVSRPLPGKHMQRLPGASD